MRRYVFTFVDYIGSYLSADWTPPAAAAAAPSLESSTQAQQTHNSNSYMYTLEMEEPGGGLGFRPVYRGADTRHAYITRTDCCSLRLTICRFNSIVRRLQSTHYSATVSELI